jgi:hypothetical protein
MRDMPERYRVCEDVSEFFGRATVLGKHDVAYFRCRGCGYVQTEEPYWLTESYSEAIRVFEHLQNPRETAGEVPGSKAIRNTGVGIVERDGMFSNGTGYLEWVFLPWAGERYGR